MKRILLILCVFTVLIFSSCQTTENVPQEDPIVEAETKPEKIEEETQIIEEPSVEIIEESTDEELLSDPEVTLDFGGEEVLLEDSLDTELTDDELEYSRSVAGLQEEISFDIFKDDKSKILAIIKELHESMNKKDFATWKKHLSKSSVSYWSNPTNLAVISKRLPSTSPIVLKNLEQYFQMIFIPSRIGREVTEIRYISQYAVKAVQVSDNSDIIFYNFINEDGAWRLLLPRN